MKRTGQRELDTVSQKYKVKIWCSINKRVVLPWWSLDKGQHQFWHILAFIFCLTLKKICIMSHNHKSIMQTRIESRRKTKIFSSPLKKRGDTLAAETNVNSNLDHYCNSKRCLNNNVCLKGKKEKRKKKRKVFK